MDPLRVYKPQKNLLLTCVYQSFWSQCSLNSEGVEQLPEGAAVAPQLWSAALAANPLDFPGQKYPRNLKMKKKKKLFRVCVAQFIPHGTEVIQGKEQ